MALKKRDPPVVDLFDKARPEALSVWFLLFIPTLHWHQLLPPLSQGNALSKVYKIGKHIVQKAYCHLKSKLQ